MEGILNDHYITTDMIAEHWKNEIPEYKTKRNTEWDADKVTKKFKYILEDMEKIVPFNEYKLKKLKELNEQIEKITNNNTSEPFYRIWKMIMLASKKKLEKLKKLEELYRSENGKRYGHFIFHDASEIIDFNQKRKDASFSEYLSEYREFPLWYVDYCNNFETDTYDSLKVIFNLWHSMRIVHLNFDDISIFCNKMQNLMPVYRNVKELKKALDCIEENNLESYDEYRVLCMQHMEDMQIVKEYIHQVYIKSRKAYFYKKRIFVENEYTQNGQKELLIEWYKKWTYVIDNIIEIYNVLDKEKIWLNDAINVLLIWYQNEKMRKLIPEEVHIDYFNNFNDLSLNDFIGDCMAIVSSLCSYKQAEFNGKAKDYHFFIIMWAFDELEEIHEEVMDNINSVEGNNEKTVPPADKDILDYIKTCIEIMKPDDIEGYNMVSAHM